MLRDRFAKTMLVVIAGLLGVLVFHPVFQPAPVLADHDSAHPHPFYVEPGYTALRKPDGNTVYGKMVIDLRNGDVWGFPTIVQGPYPIDVMSNKPVQSHPIYLGQFVFSEVTRPGR